MATKGVELASAYVSLSVSTKDIPGQVSKAFDGAARSADAAGRKMGQDMASAMAGEMSKGGSKAGDAAGRAAAKQVGKHGRAAGEDFSSAMRSGMSQSAVLGWFSEFKRDAAKSGNVAGYAVGRAMGASITAGLAAGTAGLAAAVGGIGYTLKKGFDRYASLDATAKRLGAMGKSADQVKSIMGDINSVVEGTPIALDSAAKSATQFLQGGVKQGEELKGVLTAIADASGASGTSFDDLAIIFGQVMNKGKLQAEEMLQLNERGIGIQAALRKEFGWTGEELQKLSEDGAITFQQLIQAVEGSFGGMAKKAGDSIDGALSNMQAAVGRVGANFIAAIFGDPLSKTEGPGGMAEAINNVTARIEGLNQWVIANREGIKQFFTDAADVAKTLAGAVKDVGGFLREHPDLVKTAAAAFVVFKGAQVLGSLGALATSLTNIGKDLDATPGKADKAAKGINAAFALIVIPEIGRQLNDQLQQFLDENFPALGDANQSFTPDQLGKSARDWVDRHLLGQNPSDNGAPSASGVLPGAPGVVNGQSPSVGGIPIPGLQPGGFTNPNNEDTGGKLTTTTQNIQSYLRNSLGFKGTIGGYRPPDGFNEHSSGKASDVMVSSAAEGNALLPNLLRQPGVQYILWQQKTWYPDGTSKGMEDRGSPTQNHMDHLHVKTYDTGGWLPPGITPVNNATGQHELILNPDQIQQLKDQGIDPNTLVHGQGKGAAPGPQQPNPSNRTGGYIPATAGNTAPVGQGGLSSILGLGEQAASGAIDLAAQAGAMGANAFAPGSGVAVQMGAQVAKRAVQYGFDMAGIWGEAIPEILMPFGVPRWLGSVDPMAFVPQRPGEQPTQQGQGGAAAQAIQGWAQPGNPAMANGTAGEGAQAALGAARQQPSYAPAAPQQPQPAGSAPDPTNPLSWLNFGGVFDQGGMLQPKSIGINLSKKPEYVMTQSQMANMQKTASVSAQSGGKGDTIQFYAQDVDGMFREYTKSRRRESRQYSGRP